MIAASTLERFQVGDYVGCSAGWQDENGDFINGYAGVEWRCNEPPRDIAASGSVTETKQVYVGIISKAGHFDEASNTPYDFRQVGFKDVQDGASNTIMYMEKSIMAQRYTHVYELPWDSDDWRGYFAPASVASMRFPWTANPGDPIIRPDGWTRPEIQASINNGFDPSDDIVNENTFGSAHPGICAGLLGDGSTHAINQNVDRGFLLQSISRSDGLSPINEIL